MKRVQGLLLALLVTAGLATAFGATVDVVYQNADGGNHRAGIAVLDTATYDAANFLPFLNPEQRQHVLISVAFTRSSATCVARLVRGSWDGQTFRPSSVTASQTFTAPTTGTIRGLFAAPCATFDAAGCNAFKVFVDAPSAGTVDVDGWVY